MPAASSMPISSSSAAKVDHHAFADDGLDSGPQDSARNQLQNELFFPDENRVAGVMAALITRHDVEAFGKQIDHFAFAFVAPLRTGER